MTTDAARGALRAFLADGAFARAGAFVTDLDGTAVIERDGRIHLPPEVDAGLERLRLLGRPVVVNTLRFPLSVIRVFADEWHRATGADLPLVTLKGSQTGRVVRSAGGEAAFEEWTAQCLRPGEIDDLVAGIGAMVDDGVHDVLVFRYPRDWRQGELIWTPDPTRVAAVADKYRSASAVTAGDVAALHAALHDEAHCMVFVLVDLPQDRLMAYQHTRPASFHTQGGVSKRSGAERIAAQLGFELAASIGAGDSPPDDFLAACGFAIVVGGNDIGHRGLVDTVRVGGTAALGELLATVGASLA